MPISVPRPGRFLLGLALALPLMAASPAAGAARHHHHAVRPAASASLAAACPDANLVPAPGNLDRVAAATLCLINDQRVVHGLAPLHADGALAAAATAHSVDMVAHDYFDHVSSSGADPLARIRRAGYLHQSRTFAIGENIATATGSLATPAATVDSWIHSAPHRANILNPSYRDTGIGVANGVPALLSRAHGATYTEDFGAVSA
jgi:uncharacterized protein YkwD